MKTIEIIALSSFLAAAVVGCSDGAASAPEGGGTGSAGTNGACNS